MSTDPHNPDTPAKQEAEVIDFEVIEDGETATTEGTGGMPGMAEFAAMGPQMIVQAFRAMIKEKLKRWFIRSLIWGTVLAFLATDHGWARWAFGIWAFIASAHLAFLLYGWYASGKQGDKLAQIFGGQMPPPGR
jgi:hypothetical protein